ncbi:5-methylcytosine-specific restriction endonuclease McrA [Kibdelosporangium aridum]|uniref:5-methylcytosine-specific restriction endonuclease McrA n=1 Tax=Kibdelosporangium aridum TaxID=2030 RepID=A0A1W2FWG8_KIBAR|nr:5-methylcytosine-specific restriction endonuclease McrA [Kibdelosporangium aridum]
MPDRKPTPISDVKLGATGTGSASLTALPTQLPVAEQRSASTVATGPPVPTVPSWGRRRVLLLNATFEPLTALPLRRAVVLVVCGKAEVVHGDPTGIVMHSATSSVEIPSVIRLSNYVRVPYRGRVPLTRAGLMHRDRYRCAYCGGRAETIDHVVPRSRGGPHTWQNCVASCAKCNHKKADKLLSELGWRLRVVPAAPRGPHWRLLAGVADADPLWLPYLGEPAA